MQMSLKSVTRIYDPSRSKAIAQWGFLNAVDNKESTRFAIV